MPTPHGQRSDRRKSTAIPSRKSALVLAMTLTLNDLWPLTLTTFSAMPTRVVNNCAKFRKHPPLRTDEQRTHGRSDNGRTDVRRQIHSTWCISPPTVGGGGIKTKPTVDCRVHFMIELVVLIYAVLCLSLSEKMYLHSVLTFSTLTSNPCPNPNPNSRYVTLIIFKNAGYETPSYEKVRCETSGTHLQLPCESGPV